jgi:hypothetical protein
MTASNTVCVFTVVNNIFTGLECTEHTCFDAIIAKKESNSDSDPTAILRILRNINVNTPIILLCEKEHFLSNEVLIDPIVPSKAFNGILFKPFCALDLCCAMIDVLNLTPFPSPFKDFIPDDSIDEIVDALIVDFADEDLGEDMGIN